jgi:hypothetical protein
MPRKERRVGKEERKGKGKDRRFNGGKQNDTTEAERLEKPQTQSQQINTSSNQQQKQQSPKHGHCGRGKTKQERNSRDPKTKRKTNKQTRE